MNRFHPAKPVSVYSIEKVSMFRLFSFQEKFLESLKRRMEGDNLEFNWHPFSEIYDAYIKGLSSYLEICKDGRMIVHVEPEKLE